MRLVVDGAEATLCAAAQKWGEVLAAVDTDCAARGVAVMDVAFDGVAVPSYRDAATLARPVAAARIDVTTGLPSDVIVSGIDETLGAAASLKPVVTTLADVFRAFELERGTRELGELASHLGMLMAITTDLSSSIVSAGDAAHQDGTWLRSASERGACIEALVQAREAGDWIAVGDVLDRDVVSLIEACEVELRRVRRVLTGATDGRSAHAVQGLAS